MPRLIALACLLAALATVGLASPGASAPQDKQPAPQPEPVKTTPPNLLSPMPGDVVGSTVVVTGTSTCKPVMLTWTPPGTTVEVPVDPAPDNTFSYTITGVSGDISLSVCCKKAMSPHGPCTNLPSVKYEPGIGVTAGSPGAAPKAVPFAATAATATPAAIPTFRPGRIVLTGPYPHDAHGRQSVYVVLENATLTDPTCHRSHAATAELNPAVTPAQWRACFANVGPGLYVVRWHTVSRTAAPVPGSYVIRVAW